MFIDTINSEEKNLFVVIVNWNLSRDTTECIDSVLSSGVPIERIILVDNGSTDGSIVSLHERFGDNLKMIKNPTNLGYVRAINQGINYALNLNAEWVFLLNNDTLVDSHLLEEFETVISTRNGAFHILAPLILYYNHPDRIWYLGDRIIPGTMLTYKWYQGKQSNIKLEKLIPVDFVSGCAMLVNRAVFDRIGLFDPVLEMYGEEVDFCWRANKAGFRIAVVPEARIQHKVSLSAGRVKLRTRYLRIRNQSIFYRRYSHGFQRIFLFAFTLVRSLIIISSDFLFGRRELMRPSIHGWWDGWHLEKNYHPIERTKE